MVAPCQILGASVVSLDATVRVVGHARDAEARAAGNRGRAAGVREAREGHSLAVVRRVRDEWRAGRRSDVLAVVARSHASARKQTHRRERTTNTYIPYLYGQTVTTVIIIMRDSKTSPPLAPNGAPCRLAKFELRTRAARLTVSGGTRLVRPLYRAGPPRLGRGARRSPWTRLPETCLLRGPSPGRSGSSCSRRPRWRCS